MPTAQEYRVRAEQCSELAKASTETYAKKAMEELAAEFRKAAERIEAHSSRERRKDPA